ncbi:partial Response regulator UvrY, partial [uncultured bacterium]
MRVLIADDHHLIREGLVRVLGETPGIAAVGEASDGQAALDQIRTGNWDVLVLDLNLPGKSGFDVLTELRQEKNPVPVLVLSMHPARTFGVRAIQAGAAGYLAKTAPTEELVRAVARVATGGRVISDDVADQLADRMRAETPGPLHENLSEREFQV